MLTKVKRKIAENGERFSIMLDSKTNLPLYYPNLFITTQIRGRGCAANTSDKYLRILQIFLKFESENNFIVNRGLKEFNYLDIHEVDNLVVFCRKNFSNNKVISINHSNTVSAATTSERINVISEYINWLAKFITPNISDENNLKLEQFIVRLKAKSPKKSNRNSKDKSLDKQHRYALLKIIHPNNKNNPFKNPGVRFRNFISILILYELGIRKSELLNIRIRDINAQDNTISIIRRPDQKDDPRSYEPNVKTMARELPVNNTIMKYILEYITKFRRKIYHARKSDFLIVVHKKQNSQGKPLSISAFDKLFNKYVKALSYKYPHFSAHHIRHTTNDIFSENFESLTDKKALDPDYTRSVAMGWKPGTSTSTTYSKRHIAKSAILKGVSYQKKLLNNE